MIDKIREQMLAEQAERIARLELRNQILLIGLLIWGALLLIWLLFCFTKTIKAMRKSASVQSGTISFTCEKCGSFFSVPADYLMKHPFAPRKSITAGTPGISGTVRISRKLPCPTCGKKTWCRQSMEETWGLSKNILQEAIKKNFLKFILIESIIFISGLIFFAAVKAVLS